MIKSDTWIRHQCEFHQMITPFEPQLIKKNEQGIPVISYGVTSYGYDVRCATHFKLISKSDGDSVLDVKFLKESDFVSINRNICLIPPNSFALACTLEYFKIPRDVLGIVIGKSTYARVGLIVNCTPLEPEWEGQITLELVNTTPYPLRIYANEGIAQVYFLGASEVCEQSYADRAGKYIGQTGVTLSKV